MNEFNFFKTNEQIESHGPTRRSIHVCLLIDTSDSMSILVDDTNAFETGEKRVGEDGIERNVVRGGVSRMHTAVESAKIIVNFLEENDTLSCITYDDEAKFIFKNLKVHDKFDIKQQLDDIKRNYYGMNSNISKALSLSEKLFLEYEDNLPKKILLFSDGAPTGRSEKRRGLRKSKNLANHNITIDCMCFGGNNANISYLEEISSFSNGTATFINYPDEIRMIIDSIIKNS